MLTTTPFEEPAERHELRAMIEQILSAQLPTPKALETDREGRFDRELWETLGAAGVLGLSASEYVGGSGGTVGDAVAAAEELARVLPSLAVDFVTCGMAMRMLAEEDAGASAKHLASIAAGTTVCAFGMSEPSVGTDLLNLRTTAREESGKWVINGQKTWTSLAQESDIIFVLARTEPVKDGKKGRGLSIIAVPTDQPGITIRRVHLAGMRAAITCEVFFDNVETPIETLVGQRGAAIRTLSQTLDIERILAAGISLGIGRGALDLHVSYAKEREAFGAPIGALQAVQHPAADSISELTAARALINTTVRQIDAGEKALELSAIAKLFASEVTARIVDRGMRSMGAMGLAEESAMQLFFRDARLQLFSPISNEMIRNILGESLGLPRSY